MRKIMLVFCLMVGFGTLGFSWSSYGGLAENVVISGVLEAEMGFTSTDFYDPATPDTDESDIVLAKMELGVDMDISEYVKGHILFLWEEDDTPEVVVDEGTITLSEFEYPVYVTAGRMVIPFGAFNSHFVSDPLTLQIGETKEAAVLVGYGEDLFDVSLGIFNGDIDETGEDNKIKNFVASAIFTPDVGDVDLSVGLSYIFNIADSNGLEAAVLANVATIADYVGGLGAFVSVAFMDFAIEAEYIGATDDFAAGELLATKKAEPNAYNIEIAYAITEDLEVAAKYEGTDEVGNLFPEDQYGVAASYGLFEGTTIALEYLHGEFENKDEVDTITAQLAIEF